MINLKVDRVVIDGKMWRHFSENEKWTYLFGFEDGARSTAMHYVPDEALRQSIYKGLPSSLTEGSTIKSLIAEIDEFYSDKQNLDIPVNSVLLVIRNRMMGVSEEKLNKYIKSLRKKI